MHPPFPTPSEYMRARRPERFSDSEERDTQVLDRSMLEFHLDTLTSRGQETDFERFARRLAAREICPNLLPQTGPTGGGDSKVDSETYPVAELIADVWYTGWGDAAATERWGFAFSAKKQWRPKAMSDVAKLVATGRGYKKAFFVSNQAISDKTRAKLEDELRKKHSIDVRILDRTWILDRVFEGRHEQLAISELRISVPAMRDRRLGPRDAERNRQLLELEEQIASAIASGHPGFDLVGSCLDAADLSRQLELPRPEVDGRYVRATRVARKYGTENQLIQAIYQHAWTTYFWFDDYDETSRLYGELEQLALPSSNVQDLELLTNILNNVVVAAHAGRLPPSHAQTDSRKDRLTRRLRELQADVHRPSSALQARTLELMLRLTQPQDAKALRDVFPEFEEAIRSADGLAGFPFESVATILIELGDLVGNVPGYDALYAQITRAMAARSGELASARLLMRRGRQQFDAGRAAEATRTFGRAMADLFKHESRHELAQLLYWCSAAYDRLGLLWAARGTALAAASLALNEFWTYSDVTPLQSACFNHLKWIELRLGRLPHALAWHELEQTVDAARGSGDPGQAEDDDSQQFDAFDFLFGINLFSADLAQLAQLTRMPSMLAGLGLELSALALRHALGDPAVASELGSEVSPEDFFGRWATHPVANELAGAPAIYEGPTVALESRTLGCRLRAEATRMAPAIEVAESVLAGIEGLLSVGMADRVMSREPEVTINVRVDAEATSLIAFELREVDGRPHVDIVTSPFDPYTTGRADRTEISNTISAIVVHVLAHGFLIESITEVVEPWFRDDNAMQRAIGLTSSIGILGNVFGNEAHYKASMSSWSDPSGPEVALLREEVWRPKTPTTPKEPRTKATPADGPPSDTLGFGPDLDQRKVSSDTLLRHRLWDQAGWNGVAFGWADPHARIPPTMALFFEHVAPAVEIYRLLRVDLGARDREERLRVSIVRGISRSLPHHYRVVLSTNIDTLDFGPRGAGDDAQFFVLRPRVHTMTPMHRRNLDAFLASYAALGEYDFTLAIVDENGPRFRDEYRIRKRELAVRDAYTIGPNDPDVAAILPDDDTIIPEGMNDAPVLSLRSRRRERR